MDERTLAQTYRELVHPLYDYVSRRCGGDRSLAEDVTQEAWLRAVATWKRDGLPRHPLAWLRTVSRNLLINYYRRTRPISLESLPPGWDRDIPSETFEFDSPATAAAVHRCLSRLRSGQARLLEAFHFEGKKVAEIATELGISERAVEGRLRRARIKLRRKLESATGKQGVLT
jgi:RNA polymerase sigma-70 factor (ECF subfamily)